MSDAERAELAEQQLAVEGAMSDAERAELAEQQLAVEGAALTKLSLRGDSRNRQLADDALARIVALAAEAERKVMGNWG